MIKEYGIEPESLVGLEKYTEIIQHFGIHRYRLIRKYPSKWRNLVLKANDGLPVVQKHRLTERLAKLTNCMSACRLSNAGNPTFDGNLSWLVNAENYHSMHPFHGLLCTTNPRTNPIVVDSENIDENNPIFSVHDSHIINRSAVDMSESIRPILESAKEIHFVDKYFQNLNPRHIRPLIEFLKIIFNRNNNVPINKVIYHTGNLTFSGAQFETELRRLLRNNIPANTILGIKRWPDADLHNRYVLTSIGGVNYGIGLDDSDGVTDQIDTISCYDAQQSMIIRANNTLTPFMDSNLIYDLILNNL